MSEFSRPGVSSHEREREPHIDIDAIRRELRVYGDNHRLAGLKGHIGRRLDPAGLLAVAETREKVEHLAKAYGVSI